MSTPFLQCVDRVGQPGSAHDLGSGGDDACGAHDGRDREERAEYLLELHVRVVSSVEVRHPRSRRCIHRRKRGDLNQLKRLCVEAGRIEQIDGAHDVFGDGTVVCVPTPGHTAGHQSLLVRSSDALGADAALLVGDACYLRQMLTDGILPPFAHDADRQRDSYALLARYEADGARLLFSHDVDNWDRVPAGLVHT